jgi:hypothetical protein
MFATIFGLILFVIPFILVFCFKNRFLGFSYILGSVLTINLLIAFVTQFFHLFFYPVIIIIHSTIALVVLLVIKYKFKQINFKFKINWWVIIGFLIIFFELWSVHFLYTGKVNIITGQKQVFASSYPYPYFSDEWVGVSLAKYSIDYNALPITNPMVRGLKSSSFPNIFVCFFSLLSEIFLLLNLVPLFGYAFLSIATGLIICLLIFILLKSKEVDSFLALVVTLFVPYVVNGANLPGLWYLIPFTGGLILFLISLIGFSFSSKTLALLAGLVSLLLYPPLIIFILPVFMTHLLFDNKLNNIKKIKIFLAGLSLIGLAVALIIYSQGPSSNALINIAINSIWRLNLDGGIPTFYIWLVMPVVILPFAFVGLLKIFKKKDFIFLTPVIIGLSLWFFYSFSENFLFIDYARLVIITSFLIIVLSGIGLAETLELIIKKYSITLHPKFILILKIFVIISFFLASFVYTYRSNWQDLRLKISNLKDVYIIPSSPVNNYLINEDLNLFKSVNNARFLSVPWKGLVLGVATNNYPLNSKQSIVSNNFLNYNDFMSTTCEEKSIISKKMGLLYVYSENFDCKKFVEIGSSSEGLHLYKFTY